MKPTLALHNLGQSLWLDELGQDLQSQGAKTFDESWSKLMGSIEIKGKALQGVN